MRRYEFYLIIASVYNAAVMVVSGSFWIPVAFTILSLFLGFSAINHERKDQ